MPTLSQTSKRRRILANRPCHHIPQAYVLQTSACSERIGDLGNEIPSHVDLAVVPRKTVAAFAVASATHS